MRRKTALDAASVGELAGKRSPPVYNIWNEVVQDARKLGLDYGCAITSVGVVLWFEGESAFLVWESLENGGKDVEEVVERMRRRLLSALEVEIGRAEYRLQELKKMKEKLSALRVVE